MEVFNGLPDEMLSLILLHVDLLSKIRLRRLSGRLGHLLRSHFLSSTITVRESDLDAILQLHGWADTKQSRLYAAFLLWNELKESGLLAQIENLVVYSSHNRSSSDLEEPTDALEAFSSCPLCYELIRILSLTRHVRQEGMALDFSDAPEVLYNVIHIDPPAPRLRSLKIVGGAFEMDRFPTYFTNRRLRLERTSIICEEDGVRVPFAIEEASVNLSGNLVDLRELLEAPNNDPVSSGKTPLEFGLLIKACCNPVPREQLEHHKNRLAANLEVPEGFGIRHEVVRACRWFFDELSSQDLGGYAVAFDDLNVDELDRFAQQVLACYSQPKNCRRILSEEEQIDGAV